MFQAEDQMGGLESILEEPGFQKNEVPNSTQFQPKKNVHKMATPHTIDHHWATIGLGISPGWFKNLKLH